MPERSDRHGWIDLLVPDGPFLSAAALDVQTVGENWPTRLSAEQRSLLTAPPASEAEEGEGWDDSSWDGRRARVTELLIELLGYRKGKTLAVAPGIAAHHHIYRARVSADFAIHAPDDPGDVRMVVICGPDATDDPSRLDPARTHTHDGWVSTPVQRAALLARHADADLALVTNGREHLLVNVVTGTTGSAMWTVNGLEDRHARDAFVALLHKQRVLHRTVPLSNLIELSQDRQHELTDTLGKQVRRAAEALVNAISRANRTSRGRLLEGLTGQQVYAATTRVLMRTVFLLVAEERGLLPVAENQLFADQYAMSTLLDKLEEDAYRNRSAMERRAGAWQRMMALSRAVHAGIEHDDLRLPAYGGNLFDPDEHPFLEARVTAADGEGFEQLDVGVVDDFTVLTMLRHLQIADGQRISFRSLDVEQIGHVYEALLDHSAVIVPEDQVAVLGLIGKAGNEPEVSLVELEGWIAKSDKELGKQLVDLGVAAEATGVYQAIDDGLAPDSAVAQTLNVAVANDPALRERVERYAPLLRTDARGVALVFRPGDVYVTETSSKRDSGTAYTPRSLAEEITKHTLDPLIYDPGPQNEPDKSQWKLKSPQEILELKICDPAVGSAAILVASIRYLAEALLQSRVEAGELSREALASGASDVESVDARVHARRAIVSRCIYGVDRDPMAIEMAKLSLWLITMARDEPFTFLDHAIRCGDSLVGVTSHNQLRHLHLTPDRVSGDRAQPVQLGAEGWWDVVAQVLDRSRWLRERLRGLQPTDIHGALEQAKLHEEAEALNRLLQLVADAVTAACLSAATSSEIATDQALAELGPLVARLPDDETAEEEIAVLIRRWTETEGTGLRQWRFLHWPIAFPEVFADGGTFDACVGNPPFMGGVKISRAYGQRYLRFLGRYIAGASINRGDLVGMFFLRATYIAVRAGFIATSAILAGDPQRYSLAAMRDRAWHVYRGRSPFSWPGGPAVEVVFVWLSASAWSGQLILSDEGTDRSVERITISLTDEVADELTFDPLLQHRVQPQKGIDVGSAAHEFDASERDDLPDDWTYRLMGGSELFDQGRPARFIIHWRGLALNEAERAMPKVLQLFGERWRNAVLERPKSYESWRERWHEQWRPRNEYVTGLDGFSAVWAMPEVSTTPVPTPLPRGTLLSHKATFFASDSWGPFAFMHSFVYQQYLLARSSRRGTGSVSFSLREGFECLAFDRFCSSGLDDVGLRLAEAHEAIRSRFVAGGTTLKDAVVAMVDADGPGGELRRLAVEADAHVLRMLELPNPRHGVIEWRGGEKRFGICSPSRNDIVSRLHALGR